MSSLDPMTPRLANLGPKSEAMMLRAGIRTVEQLRALGSVRAYVMVKRVWSNASLNLLWALEGALTNRPWREVAKADRLGLLLQVDEFMSDDRIRANRAVRPNVRGAARRSSRSKSRAGRRGRRAA